MPRSYSRWNERLRPEPKFSNSIFEKNSEEGGFSLDVSIQSLLDTLSNGDSEILSPDIFDGDATKASPDAVANVSQAQSQAPPPNVAVPGRCTQESSQLLLQASQIPIGDPAQCPAAGGDDQQLMGSTPRPQPQMGPGPGLVLAAEARTVSTGCAGLLPTCCAGRDMNGPDSVMMPLSPVQLAPLQRSFSCSSDGSLAPEGAQQSVPGPSEPLPQFMWAECNNLLPTDELGPVRQPSWWPAVQIQVQVQTPLLYFSERRYWMWHKKWCATLPTHPSSAGFHINLMPFSCWLPDVWGVGDVMQDAA